MPSHITTQQYSQAVLEHVQTGVYPESEEVISADFPPSALPEISKLVEQAREDVKVSICGTFIGKHIWLIPVITGQYQNSQQRQRPGYRWLDFSSQAAPCRHTEITGDSPRDRGTSPPGATLG